MMTLNFDFKSLFEDRDEKSAEYLAALDREFASAGIFMVKKFQDEQLSGRKAGDVALNVKTGTLRNSIQSLITKQGDAIKSTIFNSGATYWEYHQTGTSKLKKRLFLDEDFHVSGEKVYSSAVEMAMAALA